MSLQPDRVAIFKNGHIRPLEDILQDAVVKATANAQASKDNVAEQLGIGRSTLYRMMARARRK